MTWAALLLMLSATPPRSVSLDGDSACAPRAVLARELQRTSLAFVDTGGDLRVSLTPHDGVFSLVVRRGGAVALERQLKDGTCDDAGLATALILERYVRQVATPPLAEVVDAGVAAPVVAATAPEKPKPASAKKKPKRSVKGDAAAWSDPYRETPTAPPLPGDEGGRGEAGATGSGLAAAAVGGQEVAATGSADGGIGTGIGTGAATGRTSSAGNERAAEAGGRGSLTAGTTANGGVSAGGTTGRSPSGAGGRAAEPVPPGATAGRSSSAGTGGADDVVPPGTTTGRGSSAGSGRADDVVPPGTTAGRSSSAGSGRADDVVPPGTTAGRSSSAGSGRADDAVPPGTTTERGASGAGGRAEAGVAASAAAGASSSSSPANAGASAAGASGPSTTAATDSSPPPRPGVRVEKAEVTHGEVSSASPRRPPVRLTRWELLAGAGAWTPTPSTLSFAISLDAAIVLDEHWRVALGGAFSFGGTVPVTDEAGATRGTLTARALLLAPAASWCTATRVRACGGVLAGLRLGIGSTAGDYIFQASTRWAPAPTFGPTAQLSTTLARFAAALDVALLINPAPSRFTVEGLTARIDTPVVEVVARLSIGLGADR